MESTFGTHSLLVSLPQAVKARGYHGGAPSALFPLVPFANGKALIEDKLYGFHFDTSSFFERRCLTLPRIFAEQRKEMLPIIQRHKRQNHA